MSSIFVRAEQEANLKASLLDGTIPHQTVAAVHAVSDTAVRRYRKKHEVVLLRTPLVPKDVEEDPTPLDPDDLPSSASVDDQNGVLRASNSRLYKALAKERDKAERLISAVYEASLSAAVGQPKIKSSTPVRDRRKKQEEVALWHTTDWQAAKVTESYNSEVCEDRVKQYVEKCQELTEIMRADHPVRHGVVLVTGDMLEGCGIFPGQEHELDALLFDQIFFVANLLEYVIQSALETYETVDVVCEYGNHGRIGKKSDGFKRSDNFDRIAYEITRRSLTHERRIKNFKLSGDWYQHHTVGNYSFMAIHGDEIKGFGGNLPSYGILRKGNAWASGVVEPFKDLYIGHYHQSMQLQLANGGSVFMTGSTESHNEFAQEFVAATGNPSQRLNFINPDKGFVTYESRIWLD